VSEPEEKEDYLYVQKIQKHIQLQIQKHTKPQIQVEVNYL
jgi:hypothetical protein